MEKQSYYQKNREKRLEYQKARYQKKKKELREYSRKYYALNRERRVEYKKEYEKRDDVRERRAIRRKKNLEKSTSKRLLRVYGITTKEYEEMVKAQNGKCLICREEKKLVIDHCHITGKVRGLLCHNCNTALGLLGEDVARIINAASYLMV